MMSTATNLAEESPGRSPRDACTADSAPLDGRLVRLRSRPRTVHPDWRWLNVVPSVPGFHDVSFAIETHFGVHIGDCSLSAISAEDRAAALTLAIDHPVYLNRGYGTDAARALCRFGFQEMDLHRITVEVLTDEAAAGVRYARLGFRIEGCRRDAAVRNGRYRDAILLGLLRGELRAPQEDDDDLPV